MRTGEQAAGFLLAIRDAVPRVWVVHTKAMMRESRETALRCRTTVNGHCGLVGMGKVHLLAGPSQALSLLGRSVGKGQPAATAGRYLGTSKFRFSLSRRNRRTRPAMAHLLCDLSLPGSMISRTRYQGSALDAAHNRIMLVCTWSVALTSTPSSLKLS